MPEPATNAPEHVDSEPVPQTETANAKEAPAIRVIVVDRHPILIWALEKLINTAAPLMRTVASATMATTAIAAVEEHRPNIVLLDLTLPDGTALDLIARSKALEAKVIVITGEDSSNLVDEALLAGASGLLHKSQPAHTILRAIERVHAGELWLDRRTTARVVGTLLHNTHASQWQPDALTEAERRVVAAVARYKSAPNKVIADALHISHHTLRNHLASIYDKLGVHHRLDVVLYAMKTDLDGSQPLH